MMLLTAGILTLVLSSSIPDDKLVEGRLPPTASPRAASIFNEERSLVLPFSAADRTHALTCLLIVVGKARELDLGRCQRRGGVSLFFWPTSSGGQARLSLAS